VLTIMLFEVKALKSIIAKLTSLWIGLLRKHCMTLGAFVG